MRFIKLILFLILSLSLLMGQDFGKLETPDSEMLLDEQEEPLLPNENPLILPLDRMLDPDEYILGPGDEIGISIQMDITMTFPLRVSPTGDLFIPSVGVCHVAGLTLTDAIRKVKTFISSNAFPQAKSNMVLLNPRLFQLQVMGAVNDPGFTQVSSVTRLSEVIELAEGFNPLAMEYEINVKHADGSAEKINFLEFLLSGDLENNPTFIEGDQITVPYGSAAASGIMLNGPVEEPGFDIIAPGETLAEYIQRRVIFLPGAEVDNVTITRGIGMDQQVIQIAPEKIGVTALKAGDRLDFGWERGISVTGFVQQAGSFTYFPGYNAMDYIALAGGNAIEGNPGGAKVIHLDGSTESAKGAELRRGDVIYVPRSINNILFGNTGLVTVIVSLTSVIFAFMAVTQ